MYWEYFFPGLGLPCCFVNSVFWRAGVFYFVKIQFIKIFYGSCFVFYLRNFVMQKLHKFSPIFCSRSFIVWGFMFRSENHLEIILVGLVSQWGLLFIFLNMGTCFFHYYLLKNLVTPLGTFVENQFTMYGFIHMHVHV